MKHAVHREPINSRHVYYPGVRLGRYQIRNISGSMGSAEAALKAPQRRRQKPSPIGRAARSRASLTRYGDVDQPRRRLGEVEGAKAPLARGAVGAILDDLPVAGRHSSRRHKGEDARVRG
jgi:hypothetical protein